MSNQNKIKCIICLWLQSLCSWAERRQHVTCLDVMMAAWTGSLQHMCHPAAGGAGCYLAHRRYKLCAHTPESYNTVSHHHWLRDKHAQERNPWVWSCWLYLQGCHAYNLIGVIEEIGQNIKNGGFRENEFLWEMRKSWIHLTNAAWLLTTDDHSEPAHTHSWPSSSLGKTGGHTCQWLTGRWTPPGCVSAHMMVNGRRSTPMRHL